MEFFEKIGKKASEAYKVTADKTGKIARETKLKLKMNELKIQVEDIYKEIGKKVYQKHITEETICIKKELEEECTKIDVLSDQIDTILKECLELKDKKQCPKCYKEIEKDVNYCPNCGEKQEEEAAKEVEILEKIENSDIEEKNENEAEIVKENLEEKTDLEKTVEIESDVETENKEENDK